MSLRPRQEPRRISRELALLALSQIKSEQGKLDKQQLQGLVLTAIRTLQGEIHEVLEMASAEVKRGNDRLLSTETTANDLHSAKAMVQDALLLAQTAINRLGTAIEIPEFLEITKQEEVRQYAMTIIQTVHSQNKDIENILETVLVDWHLNRISKIDQDVLKIAIAEMVYLNIPHKVAINEAVELAKRYSDQEGHRFINGVLRRANDYLNKQAVNQTPSKN